MKPTTSNDALIVLKALQKESLSPSKRLSSLEIKTQEDFELAGVLLKQLKGYGKQALEREEQFTTPMKKLLTDMKNLFNPFRDSVALIELDTKDKMLAFVERNKQAQLKLEKQFASGEIKKVSTLVSKQTALEITSTSAQVRKVWTAIEVDARKTPREYLIPDTAAIKAALKDGKTVAGWEWKQIESIAV